MSKHRSRVNLGAGLVVLFAILMLSTAAAKNQKAPIVTPPIDPDTNLYTFQEVVQVEGASETELHSRARNWLVRAYVSADSVIQLDDRDAGLLIGHGVFKVKAPIGKAWIEHTLRIETKNGRYRVTLTDLVLTAWGPMESEKKLPGRQVVFARTIAKCEATLADLKKAMSAASEDW